MDIEEFCIEVDRYVPRKPSRLLMALWRIKRPEGLKEHSPQELGRVLGLDRAPEVKTLRRKLVIPSISWPVPTSTVTITSLTTVHPGHLATAAWGPISCPSIVRFQ